MRDGNGKILESVEVYQVFEVSVKISMLRLEYHQKMRITSMVQEFAAPALYDFFKAEIKSKFIIKMIIKKQHYT